MTTKRHSGRFNIGSPHAFEVRNRSTVSPYDELESMSGETKDKQTDIMEYGIDVELSERELLSIGKIVALWGSLEYEIFCQTLKCLAALSGVESLPKEMNNLKFSLVLELWETHVVNNTVGERKKVLEKQCKAIHHYHEFRNALVHGMWDWSLAAPEKITAIRIRKREILRTHFTADDLELLASELAKINFNVRYPGGSEEYATAMAERGAHLSRRGLSLMTKNPLADDLFRSFPLKGRYKV